MLHFCRIVLTRNKNNNLHIFKSASEEGTVILQLFKTRSIWIQAQLKWGELCCRPGHRAEKINILSE
jgi:hypothetical protein